MVSGQEILGYKGNAEAAGGLSKTPEGTGADSLDLFNKTMANVANQRFQWDVMRYKQNIKDRDDILKLVSEQADATKGIDLLDKDKQLLQQKLQGVSDNLIENVRKYGNIKSNLTAYADVQKKVNEYQQSAQSAKARAIAGKALLVDASKETNAIDRKKMLEHYQDQFVNKGIDHLPEPYFQRFKYDPSLIAPDVKEEPLGKKYEGDYEVLTKGTPFAAFRYNKDAIATGNDNAKNVIQHQQAVYQDALSSGLLTPDYVKQINAKLDQFNNAGNFKRGDYDYAPHVAEVGEDGQVSNVTQSPQEFARDLHILGKFNQKTEKDISKDKIALNKSKADITQSLASANASNASAAHNYAEIADLKATQSARIEKLQAEATNFKQKGDAINGTAYTLAADALGLVKSAEGKPVLNWDSNQKAKAEAQFGLSKGAEFREISPSDPIVKELFAKEKTDELSGKIVGRAFNMKRYYLVKDGNDIKIIGTPNRENFADGEAINIGDAAEILGRSRNNFNVSKISDKDNQAGGIANKIVRDNLGDLTPQKQNAPHASTIPASQISDGDVRQGAGGVEVRVNGEWRKAKGKNRKGDIILE